MIKLTGLWENKNEKGETYFTGTLGNCRILAFRNSYKKEDNEPDFILYLDERKPKEVPKIEEGKDPF